MDGFSRNEGEIRRDLVWRCGKCCVTFRIGSWDDENYIFVGNCLCGYNLMQWCPLPSKFLSNIFTDSVVLAEYLFRPVTIWVHATYQTKTFHGQFVINIKLMSSLSITSNVWLLISHRENPSKKTCTSNLASHYICCHWYDSRYICPL